MGGKMRIVFSFPGYFFENAFRSSCSSHYGEFSPHVAFLPLGFVRSKPLVEKRSKTAVKNWNDAA